GIAEGSGPPGRDPSENVPAVQASASCDRSRARAAPRVAVLALGRVHQPEVHAHRVLLVVRPQAEGVVAQVLAGLDVVLVSVGPVELDLLALVRNRVDTGL